MDVFINTLLRLSLKGSLVIGIVILVRFLLKKAPKVFSYSLWTVAFISLIFPFSIKSSISFANLIPREITINSQANNKSNFIIYEEHQGENNFIEKIEENQNEKQSINPNENTKELKKNYTESNTLSKEEIYFYTWLSGVMILIICSIVSTIKLKKRLKGSRQVGENVYENKSLETAFVFGLIRPNIYLPSGLSIEEEKYIRKHEEVHIERLDHLWKFLAFIITCIHFFNPLVWLAYYLMGLDMELSCDEKVIKDLGNSIKKDYSKSLLSFATGRKILTASPIAFGENNTKTRIKNILAYKKPKKFVLALCFILLAVVAVGCLTDKNEKESNENSKAQAETQEENLDSTRTYPNPEEFLKVQIENQIKSLFSYLGYEISDYRIDDLEKVSKDLNIDGKKIEVYKYAYSLKTKKAEELAKTLDGKVLDQSWVSDFNRTPYLIFEKVSDGYRHKGYIEEDKFSADLPSYYQEFMVRAALVSQDENASVEDFAKSYIGETILSLYSAGASVSDYKIDKLEKFLSYDDIDGKAYEVYKLNYSLKFNDKKSYDNYDGFIGKGKGDKWIGECYGDNYMIFQLRSSGKVYITTASGVEGFLDDNSKEENENILREILERNNIITRETYTSEHYVASFKDFLGRAGKALLSQPVEKGKDGIWIVERWIDENGNVYYEDTPNSSDLKTLQDKVKSGEEAWRKDPREVALNFTNSMEAFKVFPSKVEVEKLKNLEDFYIVPVSEYTGYIEEINLDQKDIGDNIHVILAEWITLEDKERIKELGLNVNVDMPGGFYVKKTKTLETFFLDKDTKYFNLDTLLSSQSNASLTKEEFIEYFKSHKDSLFSISTKNGKAIEISEVYLP